MIRAILFDFYSVWLPDRFSEYLAIARQQDEALYKSLAESLDKYFQGEVDLVYVTDVFRYKLGNRTIDEKLFQLHPRDIALETINFMKNLHSHFVKLGVLANLGKTELELLTDLNQRDQLFEIIASPLSLDIKQPLLSREVFVAALNGIGEPPANCLVVTGNDDYIRFANDLEVKTAKFVSFPRLSEQLDFLLANNMM